MSRITENEKILKNIALTAAGLGLVVCLLVIANFFQLNRVDPVNTELVNQLVERLNQNPQDGALREQIRELDLLARKAYFTNLWQIKIGGLLILISLAVAVIAMQLRDINKRKKVVQPVGDEIDLFLQQKKARTGIFAVSGILVITALVMVLLTMNKMGISEKQNTTGAEEVAVNIVEDKNTHAESVEESTTESIVEKKEEVEIVFAKNIAEPDINEQDKELNQNKNNDKNIEKEKVEPEVQKTTVANSTIPSAEMLMKNFTGFRGFQGKGIVKYKNVPQKWNGLTGENILWKSEVPVQGYNSPIVWENKVFLSGANETTREVFCYDALSGMLLWRTKVSKLPGSPAVAPKTSSDTGLAAASMATDGVLVFVIFGTGDCAALTMDGNIAWARNLGVPENHYGHSSSLLVIDNKLIVQYDQKNNPRLMALDTKTGTEIWKSERKVKISWASPILAQHDGKSEIITVADPFVISNNPLDGKENWKLNCIYGEVGPSATFADGKVFAVNEYAKLVAIDIKQPDKVLWESDEILSDVPSPVVANNLLVVAASYGLVGCFNASTGELLWDQEMNNTIYSSPMLVNNVVYLTDTKGNTHIFKLENEYSEIATCPLGEDVYATPAFTDERVYIRGNKHLYCIGK